MKHMIWKIFGSKGSRKRMICGVLALVLVCASLIGCASKQIGVDAVPQEVLDTQTPEVSTQKDDEPTTPVEPTEVTDVTEAPKDTEATEPETEPTEAPTEEEVKPTEPKATEAPKPTEPKPTEAPKPTEPKPTEAPKPTEPKPTEAPKPTEPKPTEAPKPTERVLAITEEDIWALQAEAMAYAESKGFIVSTKAKSWAAEGYVPKYQDLLDRYGLSRESQIDYIRRVYLECVDMFAARAEECGYSYYYPLYWDAGESWAFIGAYG